MTRLLSILDSLPLGPLALAALLLAAAPVVPEPHLVEKLRMLGEGTLRRPIDLFDLALHGGPLLVLMLRLLRGRRARN